MNNAGLSGEASGVSDEWAKSENTDSAGNGLTATNEYFVSFFPPPANIQSLLVCGL
jgi:hypothetical protein